MGTWGTGIYQCDIGEDVRSFYRDQLHRGKSGEEITQMLLWDYSEALQDPQESVCFWLALADTQYEMGRLEPFVKDTALKLIRQGADVAVWDQEAPKKSAARMRVIRAVEEKLLSPPKPPKKVSQYRLYHCPWKVGDVYAYPMQEEIAKGFSLSQGFFLIETVDYGQWHPGHTIPICRVKICGANNLPRDAAGYDMFEYMQSDFVKYENRFLPIDGRDPQGDIREKSKFVYQRDEYGYLPVYRIKLIMTSPRAIPKALVYLGNFQGHRPPEKEFVPFSKLSIYAVTWKEFESKMLDRYHLHNLRESILYVKR